MKWIGDLLTGAQPQPADCTFGLRRPGSQIGDWHGAFVFERCDDQRMTGTYVQDADFIGWPKRDAEAVGNFALFSAMGWQPMGKHDIELTAGVMIDEKTSLDLPRPSALLRWWNKFFVTVFVDKRQLE